MDLHNTTGSYIPIFIIGSYSKRALASKSSYQTMGARPCPCPCPLTPAAASIARNLLAISGNVGLTDGSADQQVSIKDFHAGSHHFGTGGRNVLLTIPPRFCQKFSDVWKSKPSLAGSCLKIRAQTCEDVGKFTDDSTIMHCRIRLLSREKLPQHYPKRENIHLKVVS